MRRRLISGATALPVVAALTFAPAALGAGDPVANGSFKLQLSGSFKKQLKRNGVSMTPKSFRVEDGSIDPVTGVGSLNLGKLRFSHGARKVTYKKVTATLGPGGALMGDGVKLFSLAGGRVTRDGFGATISGAKASFLGGGAGKLNRKLGRRSLHKDRAGTAAVSAQPKTVEVTGGTATVSAYSSSVPGSVASKLGAHCVNMLTEATAVAPGTSDGELPPTFTFPVAGGTISPAGTLGAVNLKGGLRLVNHQGSGCNSTTHAQLDETDFGFDLERQIATAHVLIGGRLSPPFGDQGVLASSVLDTSNLGVSASPGDHTITVSDAVIKINGGTALYFNVVLPQPKGSYNPAKEFLPGDVLGTAQLTVSIR